MRRGAVRSALCLALVLGLFAGGVNASPAFAAAMEELPILGRLVQVFRVNAPSVDGGQTAAGGRAALTMEREGDTEWLTLRYEQSSAGRYHAEFASFPKTVTLTLPGTERVEILSELSRAQDTSQYIKSVYTAEGWVDSAAVVQLELESDADVQLREYQEPGSIVIRLTPAENRLDTIYSLRTLSADSRRPSGPWPRRRRGRACCGTTQVGFLWSWASMTPGRRPSGPPVTGGRRA